MILLGLSSYKGVENINFDDVSLNLTEFFLGFDIHFRNGSSIQNNYPDDLQLLPQVTYSGFIFGWFLKCFALHPKFANIRSVNMVFNSSFYPNGIRPSSTLELSTVVAFHLPGQSLTMPDRMKYTWPIRSQKNFYRMNFKLQQIEILKRRNKRNDPCITDDYNFDQVFLDDR